MPQILDIEVCQVLRRYVRTRQLPDERASVAIAERLGGTLVTCDARLGRSHGHRAAVQIVEA